jgi:hypothetical protein
MPPHRKKKNPPRFGPVAIATILTLGEQGKTLEQIRTAPFVVKQDGTRPCQQAVWYVLNNKRLLKKRGTWTPRGGAGTGGGRPRKLTPAKEKSVVKVLKKHRFDRARAPWIRKKLKLPCSDRTVRRVINRAGYWLPALINKRVLGKADKKKRLEFVEKFGGKTVAYWRRRGFGDAKFWYLARTEGELAAAAAKKGRVYRKKSEAGDPRFHGGKAGTYQQGKRVGVFGVLAGGVLKVAFLKRGRLNAGNFAAVTTKNFRIWLAGRAALVLDGEKCMHGTKATEALEKMKVKVEKLPPASPDFNPVENAWAELAKRLKTTDPGTMETEKAFKARVTNAVRWLNENMAGEMQNMVESMPDRLAQAKEKKGARTGY